MPFSRLGFLRATASPRPTSVPQLAPTPVGPNAPSGLAATAVEPNQIDLTWTDNSNNETGFPIRRGLGTGPGPTDPLDVANVDATSYSDFSVEPDTTYFYTVHAINEAGASGITGPASATTPSVGITLQPDFFSPSDSVIEGQSFDLRARVLNPDESIHTNYTPSDWDFSIIAGGSFGSIGGANNDVLTLNASTAGNSITVRASYVGAETLDPPFDDAVLNIVTQPVGGFPEDLEPAGMTQVMTLDGSTLALPEPMFWVNAGWESQSRFGLVSDAASKFGTTMEKRAFVGDNPGEQGVWATTPNAMDFREIYARIVFKRSDNFQRHSAGDKFMYIGKKFAGVAPRSFTLGTFGQGRIKFHNDTEGRNTTAGVTTAAGVGANGSWLSEGDFEVTNGVYHTLQFLWRVNTNGNQDGFMRCKLNNDEVATWENIAQSPNATGVLAEDVMWKNNNFFTENPNTFIEGWQMFYFWGGTGGSKVVNDNHRISEIYVSGRNP